MSTVEQIRLTPDDLLQMRDGDQYELVDGRLVETNASLEAAWITTRSASRLTPFVRDHDLGHVLSGVATYECFPFDPGLVRKPRLSFIARGRLSQAQFERGHCRVAPDLAVEVVSPDELYTNVTHKVAQYRRAFVRLIWVLDPGHRSMIVYRESGVDQLTEQHELSGEDVIPGFSCPVSDLFPTKESRAPLR